MSADLHVHTTFSDGTQPPQAVIALAKKVNLKTLAITDHDVFDGVAPAMAEGKKLGVEVVAGIEFTTETTQTEVHILGYFIDRGGTELLETLGRIQAGRKSRIWKMAEKLKALGIVVPEEKINEIVKQKSPGRPHLARVLIEEGMVANFKEAFDRFLDFHAPAYVSHYKLSPTDAIRLVRRAGGVSSYAHPGVSDCDEIIPELIAAGLCGLEAYYPSHSNHKVNHYLNLCRKFGLLPTGGSDFHGLGSGRDIMLGEVSVSDEQMDRLRERAVL